MAQPIDPREPDDREPEQQEVAAAPRRGASGQHRHQARRREPEVDDRVGDRDDAAQRGARPDLLPVDGEDDGGEGQEDGDGIHGDRDLLDPCEAAVDGDDERRGDGRGDHQEAQVRRGRHVEVAHRGLRHPQDLPDQPGHRPGRDQQGDPPVRAARLAGDEDGIEGGEAAGSRPVGVLPEDGVATEVERGEGHEQPDDDHADAQHDRLQRGITEPGSGAGATARATRAGIGRRERHRSHGCRSEVPLGSGVVHLWTLGDADAPLHYRFAP